ncbi:MAG: hypothetical protein ACREIM_06965 [Nitrospiraceae bacterium]
MAMDPEKLHMSPGEELLELMQDIRDELRQIREYSERHDYRLIQIDSIKTAISDAAKDVTYSLDSLEKELAAKLAPLSHLAKILEHDQDLGKELTKLIDESTFQLGKKLDGISRALDEP